MESVKTTAIGDELAPLFLEALPDCPIGNLRMLVSLGVGNAFVEPFLRGGALALGAVPIAAAVVGNVESEQSSQRATCPPRAAVRQLSIADITLSWARL